LTNRCSSGFPTRTSERFSIPRPCPKFAAPTQSRLVSIQGHRNDGSTVLHPNSRFQIGWSGEEGVRPLWGKRTLGSAVCRVGSAGVSERFLVTDGQVTLSPSWVIEPTVEIRSVRAHREPRRRVCAASSSYLMIDLAKRVGTPSRSGLELTPCQTWVRLGTLHVWQRRVEQSCHRPDGFIMSRRASSWVQNWNCTPPVRPAQYPDGVSSE
jgi:hypothetical protein